MSRKNRNARNRANKSLNAVQLSMPFENRNSLRMLTENCGVEYTTLSSAVLESDTSYQRPIDAKRVQRIVENFDPRVVNPLKVSFRGGRYYVFDGAHTLAALKEVKKFANFSVDCLVFHGLTYEDEAYLFALQRGESKDVAAGARLKALFLSNDERARDLAHRTEAAGFQLSFSHTNARAKVSCIAKLWKIYSISPELYSETMSILMEAWRGEPWSLTANVIGGLALFIHVFGDGFSRARLLKQIKGTSLDDLIRLRDNMSSNKDYAYAFAIFKLYNRVGGKGTLMPYDLYDYKL